MKPKQIENFFRRLDEDLNASATVYLTGACAAAVWGGVRPSQDIDFGLRLNKGSGVTWEQVYASVERTTKLTGIPASVAEDIDRWGMITLLNYQKTSKSWLRLRGLDVRLLDPATWAIGKLTRFLESDILDVVAVFRRQKVDGLAAARVWGRALRASPPSTTQFQFRRQVELFLASQGKVIWGRTFDTDAAIRTFKAAAKIRS